MNKKDEIVKDARTKATGPLVKIASPRKNHGEVQFSFLLLAILLQNKRRLIPKFPHKRASLTAVLLQTIINGDKAKLKDATIEVANLLAPF